MTREVLNAAPRKLLRNRAGATRTGRGDAIMSRRKWGFRNVRHPEQLEARAMLAAGGFMPFVFGAHNMGEGSAQHAGTQCVSTAIAGQLAGNDRGFASFGQHSTTEQTSFTATLTDSSGTATGTATYSTHTSDGEVETTVSVSIT